MRRRSISRSASLLGLLLLAGCASRKPCPPCAGAESDPALRPRCEPDALDDFLQPDGTLRVRGKRTLVLGPGPYTVARVCVEDQGSIRLCASRSELRITGPLPSIINGGGIGPVGPDPASLLIGGPSGGKLFLLADNVAAPMEVVFDVPAGDVTMAVTGKRGLDVSARGKLARTAYNPALGDTGNFPRCVPASAGLSEPELTALCQAEPQTPRGWPPLRGQGDEPRGQVVRTFAPQEAPHVFTVPAGVSQLTVEAWGGGGGGGSAWKANAHGGGGGFVRATLAVSPEEELRIFVAGGGKGGSKAGFGELAGGGGGASYVMRGETILLVAGGGGGAGTDGCSGCRRGSAGAGGGGGGAEGARGDHAFCYSVDGDCATAGGGGTASGGGRGGSGPTGRGSDGHQLAGGGSAGWSSGRAPGGDHQLGGVSTAGNGAGGGGGAGWFGGGGGGYRETYCGAGGGGGSSYSDPENVNAVWVPAAGPRAGNPEDRHYAEDAGDGGIGGASGHPGRVVIVY